MRFAWLAGKVAFALWIGTLLVAQVSTGQEPFPFKLPKVKPIKERPAVDKSEKKIFEVAQKTFHPETERDKWMKVMEKLYPAATRTDGRDEIDFGAWILLMAPAVTGRTRRH